MHGPFGVEQSTSGDAASAAGKEQAPLLGDIGNNAAKLGSSAPVERLTKLLKPTAAGLSLQAAVESQQAVKLSVKHEGWYRVEQSDLVACRRADEAREATRASFQTKHPAGSWRKWGRLGPSVPNLRELDDAVF